MRRGVFALRSTTSLHGARHTHLNSSSLGLAVLARVHNVKRREPLRNTRNSDTMRARQHGNLIAHEALVTPMLLPCAYHVAGPSKSPSMLAICVAAHHEKNQTQVLHVFVRRSRTLGRSSRRRLSDYRTGQEGHGFGQAGREREGVGQQKGPVPRWYGCVPSVPVMIAYST